MNPPYCEHKIIMLITCYKNHGKKNIQHDFPKKSAFLYKAPTEWIKCRSKLENAQGEKIEQLF